ncbi:hypothetical protein, partial [Coralloluteibacterium thermophilus]
APEPAPQPPPPPPPPPPARQPAPAPPVVADEAPPEPAEAAPAAERAEVEPVPPQAEEPPTQAPALQEPEPIAQPERITLEPELETVRPEPLPLDLGPVAYPPPLEVALPEPAPAVEPETAEALAALEQAVVETPAEPAPEPEPVPAEPEATADAPEPTAAEPEVAADVPEVEQPDVVSEPVPPLELTVEREAPPRPVPLDIAVEDVPVRTELAPPTLEIAQEEPAEPAPAAPAEAPAPDEPATAVVDAPDPEAAPSPAAVASEASEAPAQIAADAPAAVPAEAEAPARDPAPAADDWDAAAQPRPGVSLSESSLPRLYTKDGALNVDGTLAERIDDAAAAEAGVTDFHIPNLDKVGTFRRPPPIDYEPTRFDDYWVPHRNLLEEWVAQGIRQVSIPIPGTGYRLVCVVSVLQFGGGCGLASTGQPRNPRPPPDVPVPSLRLPDAPPPGVVPPADPSVCRALRQAVLGARSASELESARAAAIARGCTS